MSCTFNMAIDHSHSQAINFLEAKEMVAPPMVKW